MNFVFNNKINVFAKNKKSVKNCIANKLRINYIYYEYQINTNVDKNVYSTTIKQRENVDYIVSTIYNNLFQSKKTTTSQC